MNWYWIAAALIVGGISVAGAGSLFGSEKRQPLAELGSVSVPSRLDPYPADEANGFAVFSFDHVPNSILLMGSNTPLSEVFAVSVWRPDARAAALEALTIRVADRTRDIRWSTQGDYRIGEGEHEVNTSRHEARIVVREYPDRQLTVGHMIWVTRSFPLRRQMELIEATVANFEQRMPVADYLRIAADRPRILTERYREALRTLLATRSVPYKLDGPVVERDGTLYDVHRDPHWGEMVTVVHPLGALPASRYFSTNHMTTPSNVPNWPEIVRFQWNGTEWAEEGNVTISPRILALLNKRHRNPAHAYFYAVASTSLQPVEPRPSEFSIDHLFRSIPALDEYFKRGDLIRQFDNDA